MFLMGKTVWHMIFLRICSEPGKKYIVYRTATVQLIFNINSYSLHTTFQDIADGETAFNSILLYPFLRAVSSAVADEVDECKTDFKDGEAQLESMTQQLKASGLYKNDKFQYKADGLVKMYGVKNLEILLLETSYHFGSKDKCKAGFDHHKGLFGSLSMLKTIADCFSLGNMESFKKVKVFFAHAAGKYIFLYV
jgi:hypothetical protein